MKNLLIFIISLSLLVSCANYDEVITIEENSISGIEGYDGWYGNLLVDQPDFVDSTEEGFKYITMDFDISDTSILFHIDTVGDTIIYKRMHWIFALDSLLEKPLDSMYNELEMENSDTITSKETPRLSWIFLGKKFSFTLNTAHPIVWTNGDMISENSATLSQRIGIFPSKKPVFIVKCLYRGEPDKMDQQIQIAEAKVKGFFSNLWDKITGWFKKLLEQNEDSEADIEPGEQSSDE